MLAISRGDKRQTTIPDSYGDLLNGPGVITLVIMMPDGRPRASPVWASYDSLHVLINSLTSPQKAKNMEARPRVTLLAIDLKNPWRYLEIRGRVAEIAGEGAAEHANSLGQAYPGKSL